MTTLVIQFTDAVPALSIHRVPEKCVSIQAMARHKRKILLLGTDGRVYCTSFWPPAGIGYCTWDSDTGLDYLPALARLGVLPKGFTITQARKNLAARDRMQNHRHAVIQLQNLCRRFGVKAPKVKPLASK